MVLEYWMMVDGSMEYGIWNTDKLYSSIMQYTLCSVIPNKLYHYSNAPTVTIIFSGKYGKSLFAMTYIFNSTILKGCL